MGPKLKRASLEAKFPKACSALSTSLVFPRTSCSRKKPQGSTSSQRGLLSGRMYVNFWCSMTMSMSSSWRPTVVIVSPWWVSPVSLPFWLAKRLNSLNLLWMKMADLSQVAWRWKSITKNSANVSWPAWSPMWKWAHLHCGCKTVFATPAFVLLTTWWT